MRPSLTAVNTPPPFPAFLSFRWTVKPGGITSLDLIAFFSGSLPGLIPLNQDSVPYMRPGFTYSVAALNSALLVRIPQQFTVSRRRFVDLGGTSSREDVVSCILEECALELVDGL